MPQSANTRFNLIFSIVLLVFVLIFDTAHAQLRTYTVLPNQTDPAIDLLTAPGDEHYVYITDSVASLHTLFVFLPGTFGRGKNPKLIVPFAARLGYHAISLTYPSDIALAQLCKTSADRACFEKGRSEIINGENLDSTLKVNRVNSITNRLQKLLVYLAKQYPAENWQQFLDNNGQINWNNVCIAGQSQGGGHAAFIAQEHKVGRVVMFAAPKDFSDHFKMPAAWLYRKSKTPIDRYFAFVHSDDGSNGCTWEEQKTIIRAMGIDKPDDWIDIDNHHPPYSRNRLLTSTKKQSFAHGSVINDVSYADAWRYLLTTPL